MDLIRVEEDDPSRCQGPSKQGQCIFKSLKGLKYCSIHAGASKVAKKNRELNNYRLTKFQAELEQKLRNPNLKSLSSEVALLRMIIEERFNFNVKDKASLTIQSGPIAELVMKVERVVSTCHKIESSMGQLMDKSAILKFAGKIVQIIGEEVSDEETLSIISKRIVEELDDGEQRSDNDGE